MLLVGPVCWCKEPQNIPWDMLSAFEGGTIPVTLKGRKILLDGDIILSINGMLLRSDQDLVKVRNALVQLDFGESIVAKIVWAGEVNELSVIKKKAH